MTTRWLVLVRKCDGTAEVLSTLWPSQPEAERQGRAYADYFKGVTLELAPVQVPDRGEPLLDDAEAQAAPLFADPGHLGLEGAKGTAKPNPQPENHVRAPARARGQLNLSRILEDAP